MTDWNGPAVYPRLPSEEQLCVPRLTKDGQHLEGWVRRPTEGVWRPSDLFWLPPSATKSTDLDGIGRILDVNDFSGIGDHDWVVAHLDKRERYFDLIQAKVRAGAYRLTAQLAKMLGIPFDEDGAELTPRVGTGTVAAKSAAVEWVLPIARPVAPRRTGEAEVKTIAAAAAARYAATGDMGAAVGGICDAVRRRRASVDPDTGLPVI